MAAAIALLGGFLADAVRPAPPSVDAAATPAATPAAAQQAGDGTTNACPNESGPVAIGTAQWNGWGRDLDNSRYQPEPALRAVDVPKLALKWAYGYDPAAVFGQPTVVDGRLFVTSSSGRVYALDSRTGCTYWIFDAGAGAGTAILVGELGEPRMVKHAQRRYRRRHAHINAHIEVIKAPSAVFFGDQSGTVYALDAEKGVLLWKTPLAWHPAAEITGAPSLYDNHLYVPVTWSESADAAKPGDGCCTLHGGIASLDIANGAIIWKSELPIAVRRSAQRALSDPPTWSAPTVDPTRATIYVAAGGSDAIVALDTADGKLRWVKSLTDAADSNPAAGDEDAAGVFGNAPILRKLPSGKQIILTGQRAGIVYGLDPDLSGAVLWRTQVTTGADAFGVEWSPAADHRNVYVAVADVHADPQRDHARLAALDLASGALRWNKPSPRPDCDSADGNCAAIRSQAVTVMPGILFSGSIDGHLRAYSTIAGNLVWDFDTGKTYRTVNGRTVSGGALGHGGATIVGGMVYVNSGDGGKAGVAGHVLLAFSIDGK